MATFTITSTGSPVYPYTANAISGINVTQTYSQTFGSNEEFNSPAFIEAANNAADNVENCYKTLPEFVQQDSNRNRTYELTPIGGIYYTQTITFTIVNAIVSVPFSASTDLTGSELTAYLQAQADSTITNFKAQWGWVDL